MSRLTVWQRGKRRVLRAGAAGIACIMTTCALVGAAQAQPVVIIDGTGIAVSVRQPLQRVISLAPSLTDMMFTLGAERTLVGAIAYQNHPPGAKHILSVGTVAGLNYERILKLRPQLVLAWADGTPAPWIRRLRELKIPVYVSRTETLNEIGASLRDLGTIIGRSTHDEAHEFETQLGQLRRRYVGAKPVRVFYQVWSQPLMTLNRRHIIADAIRTCGGRNVFESAAALVPRVNTEAVLAARPQVIATSVAGGPQPDKADGLANWRHFPGIPAVRDGHLIVVDADEISRPTPRILNAVRKLCDGIDRARKAMTGVQPG